MITQTNPLTLPPQEPPNHGLPAAATGLVHGRRYNGGGGRGRGAGCIRRDSVIICHLNLLLRGDEAAVPALELRPRPCLLRRRAPEGRRRVGVQAATLHEVLRAQRQQGIVARALRAASDVVVVLFQAQTAQQLAQRVSIGYHYFIIMGK
jgi:hypothetical protein